MTEEEEGWETRGGGERELEEEAEEWEGREGFLGGGGGAIVDCLGAERKKEGEWKRMRESREEGGKVVKMIQVVYKKDKN